MKIFSALLFTALFLLLPVVSPAADKNLDLFIDSISFQIDNEKQESINFALNGVPIPKIFTIKGKKPRIVFDFFNTFFSNNVKNVTSTNGMLVKKIRVGAHRDPVAKTRVVVDLAPNIEYRIEQDFLISDYNLEITIHKIEPEK
jgi:hypothetical protein